MKRGRQVGNITFYLVEIKTPKIIPVALSLQCIQKSYSSHLSLYLLYWENPLALPPELTAIVLYKSFRIDLKKPNY